MLALVGFVRNIDWLAVKDVLTALLTPTLAVFMISQYRFNRLRRLQTIADKRQAVSVAIMELTSYLVVEGRSDRLDVRGIKKQTAKCTGRILVSACLFAPEDRLRIIEFNRKAYRISTLIVQTKGAHNQEIDDLLEWFEHEYNSVGTLVSENRSLFWT